MGVERTPEPDAVAEPETTVEAPEMKADEAREAMKVGVTRVVGTASLIVGIGLGTAGASVGKVRPLWPKAGALFGSKAGPLSGS